MAHGGIAMLAVVFALGFAAYGLADAVAREVVSAVVQHTVAEEDSGGLTFTVFGTQISYFELLHYAVVVALVGFFLLGAWLLTRRTTRVCPECRSPVPSAASVCRYCTTELAPRPADA